MISREIKALLIMQALNEISDGVYPDVSSHGEGNWQELERQVKHRIEELSDAYEKIIREIE
jgi:coenzyme F420-reducing hydrogenase delta subunit